MWAGAGKMEEVARSEGARERGAGGKISSTRLSVQYICNIAVTMVRVARQWSSASVSNDTGSKQYTIASPPYYQRAPVIRLYNSCRTLVITAETGTVAPTVR